MITEMDPLHRRPIRDTPCARCGHGNAHGLGLVDSPPCREWMRWIAPSSSSIYFGPCGCPEWIDPKIKPCICGARATRGFLNGRRACSPEHAMGLLGA